MTLSAKDLTAMRSTLNELLPDTCNLLTATDTVDGQGGYTQVWGTTTASVKCRLDPGSGEEVVIAGALKDYNTWKVTLPHDTTITTKYRIEIGSNSYNVVAIDDSKSWKGEIVCDVELV